MSLHFTWKWKWCHFTLPGSGSDVTSLYLEVEVMSLHFTWKWCHFTLPGSGVTSLYLEVEVMSLHFNWKWKWCHFTLPGSGSDVTSTYSQSCTRLHGVMS